MTTMQRIALLLAVQLCVCGTLAVSSSAEAEKEAKTEAIPSMAEYEAADFSHVCLRATSIHNCDFVGFFAGLYVEEGLQCCHGEAPYHNSMSDSLMGEDSIGKCSWTFSPTLDGLCHLLSCLPCDERDDDCHENKRKSLTNLPGGGASYSCETFKLGTYSVQCDFKKGAEECGDGVCDDMILQSTGPMYWAPVAFLKGLPSLFGSGDLPPGGTYKRFMAANAGKVGTGQWDAMLQIVSEALMKMAPGNKSPSSPRHKAKLENTNNRGEHSFILGAALVTAGPVSVFSKHTNLKYKEGFLHATPVAFPTGDTVIDTAPGPYSVVVDPFRYDLKLKRGGAY